MSETPERMKIVWMPSYSIIKATLELIGNVPKHKYQSMEKAIRAQQGTPQENIDWTDPDSWIGERLQGEDAQLAKFFWEQSNKIINPRHLADPLYFLSIHHLIVVDGDNNFQLTHRGKSFLAGDQQVMRSIDGTEGIIELLAILSRKSKSRRAEILLEWEPYVRSHSNLVAAGPIQSALYCRLKNLIDRDLVAREGIYYSITSNGKGYIADCPGMDDPLAKVHGAINTYNEKIEKHLHEKLMSMSPASFEKLVGDLLLEMGYEDVVVTKESGDKGVDVIAKVQFGITTITEVVQVKRHQGSIQRPVLDQLRGVLPLHKALRGTIITTGTFSKGCKEIALFQGAAPIGLIDGEKLIELLIEHQIGITKKQVEIFETDDNYFISNPDALAERELSQESDDESLQN